MTKTETKTRARPWWGRMSLLLVPFAIAFWALFLAVPPGAYGQDAAATVLPGRITTPPAAAPGQPPPPQGGQEVWTNYLNQVYKYLSKDKDRDQAPRQVPGIPAR